MLGAARFVGRDEELVRPGDGCCSVPSPCAEAMEYWQSLTGRGAVVEGLGWAGLGWAGWGCLQSLWLQVQSTLYALEVTGR